jgi:hypothetical protein
MLDVGLSRKVDHYPGVPSDPSVGIGELHSAVGFRPFTRVKRNPCSKEGGRIKDPDPADPFSVALGDLSQLALVERVRAAMRPVSPLRR